MTRRPASGVLVGGGAMYVLIFSVSPALIDGMERQVVSSSPEVMGGTPVFAGTRVPIQTLIDYIEAGESIEEFLKGFPTVKREQVVAFLEEATKRMIAAV